MLKSSFAHKTRRCGFAPFPKSPKFQLAPPGAGNFALTVALKLASGIGFASQTEDVMQRSVNYAEEWRLVR